MRANKRHYLDLDDRKRLAEHRPRRKGRPYSEPLAGRRSTRRRLRRLAWVRRSRA